MISPIFEPEPRTEPVEPEVFNCCTLCGGEIYYGERYYNTQPSLVCCRCMDILPYTERIAGEDDE